MLRAVPVRVRVVRAQDLEELLVARGSDVGGDDSVHGVVLLSPALQSQPDRARGGHGPRRELVTMLSFKTSLAKRSCTQITMR